jgi:hypothetical protein
MSRYPYEKITSEHGRMSQLTRQNIIDYFGSLETHVLGFGAMFWIYGFEKTQPYPLESYFNYMDVDLYQRIVKGLRVAENLHQIVTVAEANLQGILETPVFVTGSGQTNSGEMISALMSSIKETRDAKAEFIAIHVRRGDYWNKCKHIKETHLRDHCYPSIERIEQVLKDYIDSRKRADLIETRDKQVTIYIATNIGGDYSEFGTLVKRYNVVFFQDLFIVDEADSGLDPSQMALIDVELCSRATMFFGNYFSSLSRSVYEKREIHSLQYDSF